jgi:hypothetical protein
MERLTPLLLAALLALSLTLAPAPASACQVGCTPINLILSYLPGVSNWGPEKATGVAELVLAEGEARGRVAGLPRLDGEVYGVWLIATSTDEAIPFGSFNTDDAQRGQFRLIVPDEIPNRPWNLLLITVQPGAEVGATQSDKRSIGGHFVDPAQRGQQPRELPNTGGDAPSQASVEPSAPAIPTAPAGGLSAQPAPAAHAAAPTPPAPAPSTSSAPATPPAMARAAPADPSPLSFTAGTAAVTGLAGLAIGWFSRSRRHRRPKR